MKLNISNRIRLKPSFSQHIVDDKRAYLFSEGGTYILNGRVFALLIPKLAAEFLTPEEIIISTFEQASPEYVLYALEQLMDADLLVAELVEDDAAANHWWNLDVTPLTAAQRLAECSVNIKSFGLPEGLDETLLGLLEQQGFSRSKKNPPTLTVLMANDYLNQDLGEVIDQLDRDNNSWLVMKPIGRDIWIGPSSDRNNVCWKCVTKRLLDNRLGQYVLPDIDTQAAIPPATIHPFDLDCAIHMIAAHITRRVGVGEQSFVGDKINVLSLDTLEIREHILLGDPGCSCEKPVDQDVERLCLDRENSFTRIENGYRTASSVETYSRISRIVSPLTGLIPELYRSNQYDSSYIYYARHGFSVTQELSANRLEGRPSWACGKGSSDIDARVSCIAEAIERYSAGYFGNEITKHSRIADLENAIHPENILLFSDEQYANRNQLNSSRNEFDWIPERFDPGIPIKWTRCTSLSGETDAYIPARMCYLNYPDTDGPLFCRADSNGCATGNTVEEALLFGLFELIERDAVSIWWYNKLIVSRVDLASFSESSVDRVVASLNRENREVIVVDITSDIGIYTFACISWCAIDRNKIYIGYGTHLAPSIAIKRALNEVMQVASYLKENEISEGSALGEWIYGVSIDDLPFLAGHEQNVKSSSEYRILATGNLVSDIEMSVELLRSENLRAYYVDLTRGKAMLPTARVIVPGLRHFWPRFAPGRLYDVPVRNGYLAAKIPESDLNRYYYPL